VGGNSWVRAHQHEPANRSAAVAGGGGDAAAAKLALDAAGPYRPSIRHALRGSELERLGTTGNLTSDAHLAVLAMERGYVLYSTGTDFARFAGLRWVNPCRDS
jgi:hypothetical protein